MSQVMDEKTARWYVENYGEHPTNRLAVELAGLTAADVVLDVGCGGGAAVRAAAAQVTGGRVLGVDPSPAMLAIAAEHTAEHPERERIAYLHGDAGHLPVPDSSVTVALAINTIHHWEDAEAGLGEVRRVLAPGGRLIVSEEAIGGLCGRGRGPLSDSEQFAACLAAAGFSDVVTSVREADGERIRLFSAALPS